MREVVIVSSVRTPVGRAFKGTLRATRPDELAAIAIKGALDRVPQLDPKEIEDVILGCAMPEAEQGMNVARIASLRAGLPVEVSAMTINRFCSSGLQAIAMAAERIMSGGAEVMVAGGTESMSMIPMGGNKISPNPVAGGSLSGCLPFDGPDGGAAGAALRHYARAGDAFSLRSHQKALAAIAAGKFEDETVPVPVSFTYSEWIEAEAAGNYFQSGRGAARRYFAGGAGRAEAGVSREGRDRGEFFADVGWRSGGRGDVGRAGEGSGHHSAGALRCVRHRRIQAGRNGTGAGVCDSEGAEAGRAEALGYRRDRIERGVCGAVAGGDPRSRA